MLLTRSWKPHLFRRPSLFRSLSSTEEPSPLEDEGPSPSDIARERQWKQMEVDESQGIFRVLDIGLPKKYELDKASKAKRKAFRVPERKKSEVEWSSVWPAPKTFHPHVVPLPIRQGFVGPKEAIPDKIANVELMKIPNFLHATPPAIRLHCASIKKYCTEWPKELESKALMERVYPLTRETSDYLNASSSLRDNRSRVTTFKFKLASLFLEPKAKDKIIRLLGPEHYNLENDEVTLVVDRCPYRKQNSDYFTYLLSALYFESLKTEGWEIQGYLDTLKFEYDDIFPQGDNVEKIQDIGVKDAFNQLVNEGENSKSLSALKDQIVSKHFELEPFKL
ncbi:ACYPI006842 protein [Caligus rogercresseyi]|uniref:ACYPI006842 protein n=1 Tax=Caligus rogercresseyi TaxID=217165 RepID=A0A7T8KAM6_CALRO|nr:ACYPI006842 protein [Caligus rogercresseyi]|eukprot:TRINITY_DN3387_c0_g1_i1.p1 TRINITY_DN3387_c0_g1~~TRINITY_DN3387_c0_g1_i1.p1  ORF type:complete len:336 (+),score=111.10 TRINITY_DN3387_c0_g1_i1:85-1092(+)